MEEIDRLERAATQLQLKQFLKNFGGFYLLGSFPVAQEEVPRGFYFHTQQVLRDQVRKQLSEAPAVDQRAFDVLCRIAKTSNNPFRDRISLGRAKNCDLVVHHHSVSKLHAHFIQMDCREDPDSAPFTLVDVDSHNGTFVNGQRLEGGTPGPVKVGDHLRFGDVSCVMLTGEAAYHRLRAALI